MAKGKKIIEVAEEALAGFLEENNLALYDAEYVKEGPDRVLRIYIDKADGYISTEVCERVSRYLSEKLDELDPIEENYVLEVSSPGLDRELKKDEHFAKYIGQLVDVSLYKAIDGEKKLTGTLISRDEKELKIDVEGSEKAIPLQQITKVNLTVTI